MGGGGCSVPNPRYWVNAWFETMADPGFPRLSEGVPTYYSPKPKTCMQKIPQIPLRWTPADLLALWPSCISSAKIKLSLILGHVTFIIHFGCCCDIGQQTNVDWIRVVMVSLVSNETNTDVRMYT